ncbi:major facilitator transporter protein [Gottschalkia purinilytica]|uniref:Major facilitator transporter protein n=1 Tax=Gottschalkia purinilytica TaxID=1503 RepID=A0A0L0WCL6_GOTPU|nr:MFS transporter [Gottschalkia purinilytica]KNF09208.1 major facilitator transporter protein [Gottschalkia purinilytica]
MKDNSVTLSPKLVLLMAITCGISVANIYYNQPLLGDLARYFNVSTKSIGLVSTFTQVGYGLGMLAIVPLGDIKERKSLIIKMLAFSVFSLILLGTSMNFYWLLLASFLVGFSSIITQLIVPFAAELASPNQRGSIIGKVLSGLLIGILLARTVSGFIGSIFGWRSIFFIGAFLIVSLSYALIKLLPSSLPKSNESYIQTMLSLVDLFKSNSVIKASSITGAMMFGAFNVFWTTLIFFLESPTYGLGAKEAGIFGLLGVAGVFAAPLIGKLSDKKTPRFVVGLSILMSLISYIIFYIFGKNIIGLIVGVIFIDLGTQSGQVSNQTRIHNISSEARSRYNTIFMFTYFLGGSIGSFLGTYSWNIWKWKGVCISGLILMVIATITHFTIGRKE